MNKVPGVKLYWEHPRKTWTHPIYSNRNAITKRFLKTDCDFLIMQDDDIIPGGVGVGRQGRCWQSGEGKDITRDD
jgi:hypothetical protein